MCMCCVLMVGIHVSSQCSADLSTDATEGWCYGMVQYDSIGMRGAVLYLLSTDQTVHTSHVLYEYGFLLLSTIINREPGFLHFPLRMEPFLHVGVS